MKREKALEQLVKASTLSIGLSLTLCMILPDIKSKADFAAFFSMFWFVGIYCIWSVMIWAEKKDRNAWGKRRGCRKE